MRSFLLFITFCSICSHWALAQVSYLGTPRVFHTLAVQFSGSTVYCEQDQPDSDQLLQAVFTHSSGKVLRVYGHWAADGNAAASGSRCGSVWRVFFTPTLKGVWTMQVRHHTGVTGKDLDFLTGVPGEFDGITDTLPGILTSDASPPDFRKLGVLTNRKTVDGVSSRYPYVTGVRRTFAILGAGSSEDLLGYTGFDGTYGGPFSPASCTTTYNSDFAGHVADFVPHPLALTWERGGQTQGEALYGAFKFLSTYRITNQTLMLNNDGGDGRNVYPYVHCDSIGVFDQSKLDQWFQLMQYGNAMGLNMELILAETENDDQTMGTSELSHSGFTYIKRMVSQFGSLPAVSWVAGEECDLNPDVAKEVLYVINKLDGYDHLIGLHTRKRNKPPTDGLSFQFWYDLLSGISAPADTNVSYAPMHVQGAVDLPSVTYESLWDDVKPYMDTTDWVFTILESGTGGLGSVKPDETTLFGNNAYKYRRQIQHAAMFRGYGGIHIYFGSNYPGSDDLGCSNYHDYDTAWAMQEVAMRFFLRFRCLECLDYDEGLLSDFDSSGVERFWVLHGSSPEIFVGYAFPPSAQSMGAGDLTLHIQQAGNYRLYYVNPANGTVALTLGPFSLTPGPFVLPMPSARLDKDWIAVLAPAGSAAFRADSGSSTRASLQERLYK